MRRRVLLRTVGAGMMAIGSGCLGGGGEVVTSVKESITVQPGEGWVTQIPDVSDPGGAVSYTARSDETAFDVYFFVGQAEYDYYDAFLKGRDPSETPRGHESFSKAAVPRSGSKEMYEATTANDGAREPLDATGPYYFVVDHSNYRLENRVEKHGDPLSAFVDLEVIQKKSIL